MKTSRSRSRSRSPRRSPPMMPGRERSRSPARRRSRELAQRHNDSTVNQRGSHSPQRTRSSERARSRSPPKGPKSNEFGKAFKWKSKTSGTRNDDERDYRSRDADNYRPRRYGGQDDRERRTQRDRERDERDKDRAGDRWSSKIDDKFGNKGSTTNIQDDTDDKLDEKFGTGMTQKKKRKDDKPKNAAPALAGATYIIVTVNDRLGTKASIPCLPSDTVGDFKKLVAMQVGRQPHEIMLKRQGERPFKDFITLGDYGVSNGVQLDLELDTGD